MKVLGLLIPPWAKLAGAGVVLACLLWVFLVLKGWHDDSQALPGVKRDRDAAIAATAQVRADLLAEAERLAGVNKGLSDENETLRGVRAATPVRSVRLCASQGTAREGDLAAPGGSDAGPAGAGELPQAPGRDPEPGPEIGPDLYALMDEADEIVRRARGGQAYISGLPSACLVLPAAPVSAPAIP